MRSPTVCSIRAGIGHHIGVSPSGKAWDFDSQIRRSESCYPCHQFYEVIHIANELELGKPERVRIVFENGSILEALGAKVDMTMQDRYVSSEYRGRRTTHQYDPLLRIDISGDIKLVFHDVKTPSVTIDSIEGFL